MGVDDYIIKFFCLCELIVWIRIVLWKSGCFGLIFEICGFYVDIVIGVVKKNGNEVFFLVLEYCLLLVFISNFKSIIMRVRLFDELWDVVGEFVNDNILIVYIKCLWEKIEDDFLSL